jgi:hypothetical protein
MILERQILRQTKHLTDAVFGRSVEFRGNSLHGAR